MRALAILALAFTLAACTYTYLPPVPKIRTPEPRLDILDSPGLQAGPTGLRLAVRLSEVPEAGWLAVQWFGPDNTEVASDSIWISPQDEGTTRTLYLPTSGPLADGVWRAVVSFGGRVQRQFALEVGSAGPGATPQPPNDENDDRH